MEFRRWAGRPFHTPTHARGRYPPGATSSSAAPARTTCGTSTSRCRRGRLIVVTGVSGSGKSSLAFDTIYAEGQRRYVESLSAYARQFLERMEKPDVDSIEGISPGHRHPAEEQHPEPAVDGGHDHRDPRLPAPAVRRVGRTICRGCGKDVIRETAEVVASRLAALPEGTRLLARLRDAGDDRRPPSRSSRAPRRPARKTRTRRAPRRTKLFDRGRWRGGSTGKAARTAARDPIAATLDALRRKGFGRLLIDGRAVALDEVDAAALAGRVVARGGRRSRPGRRRRA